jgi:hypothetical protein
MSGTSAEHLEAAANPEHAIVEESVGAPIEQNPAPENPAAPAPAGPDVAAIVKAALKPFSLTHGFGLVGILILVLSLGAVGAYVMFMNHRDAEATREDVRVLKAYVVTMNQQTILMNVINENLRVNKTDKLGTAPIDMKVATAKMMYDMATLEKVPIHILCAIAEVESGWNTTAVSASGCEGLLQVTPAYARLCLQAKGLDYKTNIWFDPVVNVMCGVKMLANMQAEHVEKGRTDPNTWVLAIHSYFWGPASTCLLFGKTDRRVDVPNMSYPQRVLDASRKYKDMGL